MGKHGAQRKHFSSVRTRPYTTRIYAQILTLQVRVKGHGKAWGVCFILNYSGSNFKPC